MAGTSDAYDGCCPECGHIFRLADLKRMAVGDGWQRYILVDGGDAGPKPVKFDEYNPLTMKPVIRANAKATADDCAIAESAAPSA